MNSDYSLNTLHRENIIMENNDSNDYEKPPYKHRVIQTIIDFVVIIIIFVIFGLVYLFQEPKIRYFTCLDTDIFYPYKTDTVNPTKILFIITTFKLIIFKVPFWAVGIFGTVGPVFFIILIELLNARLLPGQKKKKEHRIRSFVICTFHALSLFILGISLTMCLTEIGKRWVGRLRPHFIAVCQPDLTKLNCTTASTVSGFVYNAIYTGGSFCTNTITKEVNEARYSFPSGHSSFSCYTMLFLIIYVEARLFLLRLRYIKPLIQLAAFSTAFVTCLSRISDYHHRGSDVIGGSTLGKKIIF